MFDEDAITPEIAWNEDETLNWTTAIDYPLIVCADKRRPQELQMMHLTNGMQERILMTQVAKRLAFVCFTQSSGMEAGT